LLLGLQAGIGLASPFQGLLIDTASGLRRRNRRDRSRLARGIRRSGRSFSNLRNNGSYGSNTPILNFRGDGLQI
jgi:hypothetical protein